MIKGLSKGSLLRCLKYLFLIACLFIYVMPAFAGGGADHVPSFSDTYKLWSSFFVFIAIFYFLLKKPFRVFWATRRDAIEKAVKAGEIELKEAEDNLSLARTKLSEVHQEIEKIKANVQKESEREAEHILEEAKERAGRIAAQAKMSAEAERVSAEAAIRRELAELVIAKAKERLSHEVNADNDRHLRESALDGFKGLVH